MTMLNSNLPKVALWLVIGLSTMVRIYTILPSYRYNELNADEERNYAIAANYVDGKGYTLQGKETSFHSSMPVFLYVCTIRHGMPKSWIILALSIMAMVLMVPAIWAFADFASRLCQGNAWGGVMAAAFFAFYPSNITYIGPLFWYEKVVMPLFVLLVYVLCQMRETKRWSYALVVIALSLLLGVLRNQMVAILAAMATLLALGSLIRSDHRFNLRWGAMSIAIGLIITVACNIPVFQKTKAQFGQAVISTQAGFELMQGHNPLARGSWRGSWADPKDPYYAFSREVIPGLDTMNELEESKARQAYAIQWALSHPMAEIGLTLRKVAIFFMPVNFQSGWHGANVLIHLLFFPSLIWLGLRQRGNKAVVLSALAVASVLALSIVFFADMRWRYYAEPFMIAVAMAGLWGIFERLRARFSPEATR